MNLTFLYSGQSGFREIYSPLSQPQACQMNQYFHSSAASTPRKKFAFVQDLMWELDTKGQIILVSFYEIVCIFCSIYMTCQKAGITWR